MCVDWQPIQTAPLGENVLICFKDACMMVASAECLSDGTLYWHAGNYVPTGRVLSPNGKPTHWARLPPEPVSQSDSAQQDAA